MSNGRYLCISDLQMPYEHKDSLKFCAYLKRHFKIPEENIYNSGDETDQYWGGMWKKSPQATHTATGELKAARDILKKWYAAFPQMKLAISNHGTRYWRKALEAEIPSEMLRKYEEIIEAPPGWIWKKHWIIPDKHPMIVEHLDDWSGPNPAQKAALYNGMSTMGGHHHSKAGIEHFKTNHKRLWGMTCGSLIDFEAYAFDYGRNAMLKPLIGAGVVLDHGATPLWIPLD